MNLSFLTSLFKKEKKVFAETESVLIDRLKNITIKNNLLFFENTTIYHHKKSFLIPIIIIDEKHGIFIFEYKDWCYDDLKNATIKRASKQSASSDTLAFEKAHDSIRDRFKEILHDDGVPIFNFLIMENLNTTQYNFLNNSIKESLPSNSIIFNNLEEDEILSLIEKKPICPITINKEKIATTLFAHYAVVKQKDIKLSTEEQINFIESDINGKQVLAGNFHTGKSSALVLKIILEKLKNPNIEICVIKPNKLSCDILKKQLLDSVEYSIIEVDISPIKIFTPIELINYHLTKLNKDNVNELFIDNILMNKKLFIADYLICDDSQFIDNNFLLYLEHIQKNRNLLLIKNLDENETTFQFTKNLDPKNLNINFYQAPQHAKALQVISTLLKEHKAKDILVISSKKSKENLKEDLEYFIDSDTTLIDSSKKIIEHNLDNLLLSTYSDMHSLNIKHIVLLDVCSVSIDEINYALHISHKSIHIIYEEICEKIKNIKDDFENRKK